MGICSRWESDGGLNTPQFLICLGVFALYLLFFVGTALIGLPIAELMNVFGIPILSDVALPVRHGTLNVLGLTATAVIIGLIVHAVFWALIFYNRGQPKGAVQTNKLANGKLSSEV
jgi:hypothetical protein